jgi:hypothetical protein
MTLMKAANGRSFGVFNVRRADGQQNLVMIDTQGNMYFDPGDPDLGLYIVRLHIFVACGAISRLALLPSL